MTTQRKYNWIPDLPDQRDHSFASLGGWCVAKKVPALVDLRPQCPPVYDQGQLGSCTANALAASFEFDLRKQKLGDFAPSRLFIYYNERSIEGTIGQDSGASLRDGCKALAKYGACSEVAWPYSDKDPGPFQKKPSQMVYAAALAHQLVSYKRLTQSVSYMRACLADGYPFVFGFTVYESFESDEVASTGVAPIPARSERALGGHAVVCVGYDESTKRFLVRNSWGTDWGQGGYFTIPYAYLADYSLAQDFWTLRLVE